jgi:hypothetical protein
MVYLIRRILPNKTTTREERKIHQFCCCMFGKEASGMTQGTNLSLGPLV